MLTAPRPQMPPYPPVTDKDAWRRMADGINMAILPAMQARASTVRATTETLDIDGVIVYDVRPEQVSEGDRRVFLDIHGGAYIVGAGAVCRAEAVALAGDLQRRVWSVDYRAPPDHPFPAPLDDCVAVYKHLLNKVGAANIIVGGASAGANLTAALVLRVRDEGLPMPAAAMMNTPHLDMTNGSDSLYTNQGLDAVLSGADMTSIRAIYAPELDYRLPYLSPLFADFSKGFSPSFLCTGTRDLFLSDTVRMHAALRAADIRAELHVTEAASHGNFHDAPEEAHVNREMRKFITTIWQN